MNKPNHHKIAIESVREWRDKASTDMNKSICMYCDEHVAKNNTVTCSQSCGTYSVWVDTSTLAQITLEIYP